MRKEMEEERRREMKAKKRDQKIAEKTTRWTNKENEHNKQVRENYREQVQMKEQAEAERRVIMRQKSADEKAAAERKAAERVRLERVRAENIMRKERARLQARGLPITTGERS